ncbi:CelD/BcsL family acetyltransferase involved in cellulose biosynthesis [Paraburkholderia sp. GAS333]|uniref:GNAT family N-acetyltransferase n=1 Tax=Paraburkholderia sp. GAS333 TaxID=3156279 RepID=UPI003D2301F5
MGAGTTGITIVADPADLQALQVEWDELWNEANGLHFQAFAVCWLCWTMVAQPQRKKLRCIVYRENGKLLLVWPLVSHQRLFWSVLDPLTPGTIEHTSMLLAQGPHSSRAIASAWDAACKRCGADIFMVPYVDVGNPLHELAERQARVMASSSDVSMKAILPRFQNWDTFCASLATRDRKRPGSRFRKLSQHGELVARLLGPEDAGSFDTWVNWMVERKREWAASKGKTSSWLDAPTYRNYLAALLHSTDEQSKGYLYIATLDGVPIAASIVGMGKTCLTDLIGAFDRKYEKFEPGLLLKEISMKRAFDLGLDVDFGVGTERFKAYWSGKNIVPNKSFQIATTRVGVLAFGIKRLTQALKSWRTAPPTGAAKASALDAKPGNEAAQP